jgi:hypothetical protein
MTFPTATLTTLKSAIALVGWFRKIILHATLFPDAWLRCISQN